MSPTSAVHRFLLLLRVAAVSAVPWQSDAPKSQDFFSKDVLVDHVNFILNFYEPRVLDSTGGFFQGFFQNGTTFDAHFKQIVSSARMVINFMRASNITGRPELLALGSHGLDYVETVHYQRTTDQYAFSILDGKPADMTQQAYAYAFLLGMHSSVVKAGVASNDSNVVRIFSHLCVLPRVAFASLAMLEPA